MSASLGCTGPELAQGSEVERRDPQAFQRSPSKSGANEAAVDLVHSSRDLWITLKKGLNAGTEPVHAKKSSTPCSLDVSEAVPLPAADLAMGVAS